MSPMLGSVKICVKSSMTLILAFFVVVAPRKPRGRTKLTKVYGRSADEKVFINLNARGQPISDDPNFLT